MTDRGRGPTRTVRKGDAILIGDSRVFVLHGRATVRILADEGMQVCTSRPARSYAQVSPHSPLPEGDVS